MTAARSSGASDRHPYSGAGVRLDRIRKTFGPVIAVNDLSLNIEAGEFITFLGPSGSGKTTMLMMIAGFEFPDSGEIYVDAAPIVSVPPYRRGIGMVFQNYALFPHMTVAENIGFALKQRGVAKSDIAREVAGALDVVRLHGYEGRYPRQLSGGQQQRVALARAIIFKPRVLLMDEPLSALDKQLREELQLEIKRLHRQLGITFIYVTHDQREALIMSDRVAVMNEGRVVQVDSPSELYDRPANRFVAGFVGESNFIAGTVIGVQADEAAVRVAGATIRAVAATPPKVGASVVLAIRPEKVFFRNAERSAEPRDSNFLTALVRDVTFVGEMYRYVLEVSPDITIVLKHQHRFPMRPHVADERVEIEWHMQDTLLV